MPTTQKQRDAVLREQYVTAFLDSARKMPLDDALRTGSGTFMFPVLDSENNERFVEITVKIPTERTGEAYDGFEAAKSYEIELKLKAEKEKEAEEAKAKKIAKDAATRAAKKAEKEAAKEKEA